MAIRVGILDHRNLGRGVECAVKCNLDIGLEVVLTRRNPDSLSILTKGAKVCGTEDVLFVKDQIDVMILCGGNAMDLPGQTPEMAAHFNVIDNFGTRANTPRHPEAMDRTAKEDGHVRIMSAGWGPGMFSLNRLYANVILSDGSDYTFWSKGVSQGRSDAIHRIRGVKDVRQYAIPVETTLMAVRSKETPKLTARDKHTRECFMVAEEGADLKAIEETVVAMPNHFAGYNITTHFISQEELMCNHARIPHGGFVIRTGSTGWNDESGYVIEYSLKSDFNPELTAPVITAYARTTYRLNRGGQSGYRVVLDTASAYLSAADGVGLRKHLF